MDLSENDFSTDISIDCRELVPRSEEQNFGHPTVSEDLLLKAKFSSRQDGSCLISECFSARRASGLPHTVRETERQRQKETETERK